jgi:2'-5' RNA ligase
MKRIFVAVDISDEARGRAKTHIEALRTAFEAVRVGWERPEKLHLTLKFLGETDERRLVELKRIVAGIAGGNSNFKLKISNAGIFPNVRNPRVLWIDVIDEAGNLAEIFRELDERCEKLGFARESRKFVPHLTIGRVREPGRAKELGAAHLEKGFEPVEFDVSEIVIYESKLLPTGSVYAVVSKHVKKDEL